MKVSILPTDNALNLIDNVIAVKTKSLDSFTNKYENSHGVRIKDTEANNSDPVLYNLRLIEPDLTIDRVKMIPFLLKAIQNLKCRVECLERCSECACPSRCKDKFEFLCINLDKYKNCRIGCETKDRGTILPGEPCPYEECETDECDCYEASEIEIDCKTLWAGYKCQWRSEKGNCGVGCNTEENGVIKPNTSCPYDICDVYKCKCFLVGVKDPDC